MSLGEHFEEMKFPPASTLLGVAAMLFGCWWVWSGLVQPVVNVLTEKKELSEYIFVFTMMPILSLPGIFAAYFGFRLTREKTARNFKAVVGWFAVFAVLCLSAELDQLFSDYVHEKIGTTLFTFLATLVIVPLYVVLTVWLMRREGININGVRDVIGRGAVLIVALQIWQLGLRLFDTYSPIKPGYTHLHEEPWEFLGFAVPIALAYLFYKLANWRLEKGVVEPPDGNQPQNQSEPGGSVRL